MKKGIGCIVQEGGKVQLIDHHKTALHFNDYSWGHVVVEDERGEINFCNLFIL